MLQKTSRLFYLSALCCFTLACSSENKDNGAAVGSKAEVNPFENFEVKVDQFADVQILRYKVAGFDDLDPKTKELVYYLYEAAHSGRDIIYDQNYKHNLVIRRTIEAIIDNYNGQ